MKLSTDQITVLYALAADKRAKLTRELKKATVSKNLIYQDTVDKELTVICDVLDVLHNQYEEANKPTNLKPPKAK